MADDYKDQISKTVSDDDTAASKLRLNQQAALMLAIKDIIPKIGTGASYQNFATMEIESPGHIKLTNALYRGKELSYFFKNSDPRLLSALLPSIKLYKVFYPQTAQGVAPSSFGAKTYSWRIPFDDVPIKFGDTTSEYVPESVEKTILEGGRLNGVGITSFNYKYVGVNPGEVNTNIEASLELFFQNIEDVTRVITIDSTDERFIPKVTGTSFKGYPFSYTDLIAPSDAHRKDTMEILEAQGLRAIDYRIKVVCGYADVSKEYLSDIMPEKKPEEILDIINAINSAKVCLYLSPYSHELNFNENGTITIKIQYSAAIDSVLSQINILEIDEGYSEVQKSKAELEAVSATNDIEIDRVKNNCSKLPEKERDKQMETAKEKKQQETFDKQNTLDNKRNNLYSAIFTKLLKEDKIWQATFPPEMLGINKDGEVLENGEHVRLSKLIELSRTVQITKTNLADTEDAESSALYGENKAGEVKTPKSSGKPDPSSSKTAANAVNEKNKAPTEGEKTGNGDFIVRFIKFGDLFDIACSSINKISTATDRPRLIVGDFKVSLPIGLEEPNTTNASNINAKFADDENHRQYINLADVPISFQMFNQFFMEKVVKPRRDFYPLLSFLSDVVTDIVLPSISPSVFGRSRDNAVRNNVRYSVLSVALPTNEGKDIITNKSIFEPFNGKIDNNLITTIATNRKVGVVDMVDTVNYVFLYCSSNLPETSYNNGGNIDLDEAAGIFHFRIGTDTGIVKKMSFSKTQNQYQRESKTAQAGNLQGGYLIEVYDVNIEMFGNNIYKPGDLLYIEPLYYTGAQAREIQYRLGLGGYYQVIDAETSINQNIFQTKLNTVLVGRVERNGKIKDVVASDSRGC